MVKDNQQELKEQVEKVFTLNPKTQADIDLDFCHGIEKRTYQGIDKLTFLDGKEDWSVSFLRKFNFAITDV